MTEPSEMIERGAEAMWRAESIRARGKDRSILWAHADDGTRERWRGLMEVAIEALGDPTEAMLKAGEASNGWLSTYGCEDVWRAMIAEARR